MEAKPLNFEEPIEAALVAPLKPQRPAGLTAVGIICLILASLGILVSISQTINLAFGRQMQGMWKGVGTAGAPPQMREAQEAMFAATQRVTEKYFIVNGVITAFLLCLSAVLIYGAILTLRMKRPGRKVLVFACAAAVLFELARAIPLVMIQLDMSPIMSDYMSKIMPPGSDQAESAAQMAAAFAKVSMVMGLVFLFVWTFAKAGFYAFAANYLTRSSVKSLFGESN